MPENFNMEQFWNSVQRGFRPVEQAYAFIADAMEKAEKGELSATEALGQIKHTLKIAHRELEKSNNILQTQYKNFISQ